MAYLADSQTRGVERSIARHHSYIDISWRTMLPLLVIGICLALAVWLTFFAKSERYGTTPFYAAVALGWQEATGSPLYSFELLWERFTAALGFGESNMLRTPNPGEAAGIPVLAYHRLVDEPDGANVTVANFKDQMEALAHDGWQTITLPEFEAFMRGRISLPAKSVLITFDDGAKESYYPVDPILEELGFNAVSYIIVDGSRLPGSTYYLTETEIEQMLKTGRWEIGSHSSVGHTPYPIDASGTEGHFFSDLLWLEESGRRETPAEFKERVAADLSQSKERLEERYGVPVRGFAFPFGDAGEYSIDFPESSDLVINEASDVYAYGFVQTIRGDYTYNYPSSRFLARRIHVDHDWSGERLLQELAHGMGKGLPYRDSFASDSGWIASWGAAEIDRGLRVAAMPETAGSSVFLDGTRAWHDYLFEADVVWDSGFAMLLGAVADADTYRACVFSPGSVRLQRVIAGERTVLGSADAPRVARGEATIGMRIQGSVTQCLYDGSVVLSVSGLYSTSGGIGFQVWDERVGVAALTVHSLGVRQVLGERVPSWSRPTALVPTPAEPIRAPASGAPTIPNTGNPVPAAMPATTTNPVAQPTSTNTRRPTPDDRDRGGRDTWRGRFDDMLKLQIELRAERQDRGDRRERGRNKDD